MKVSATNELVGAEGTSFDRLSDCSSDRYECDMEGVLLQELLQARRKMGLTQVKLAEKMGTKASAVARLELALSGNPRYATPTIATLKKYAQAVECKLEIHLVSLHAFQTHLRLKKTAKTK